MTTAPGWFPDPADPQYQRYWDGQAWTEHRAPVQATPAPQYPQYPMPPQFAGPNAPNTSNTLSIVGIVCGAIALVILPPLFGIAGLILGAVAMSKKERLAGWALGVSGVGLVGGMVFSYLVLRSRYGG